MPVCKKSLSAPSLVRPGLTLGDRSFLHTHFAKWRKIELDREEAGTYSAIPIFRHAAPLLAVIRAGLAHKAQKNTYGAQRREGHMQALQNATRTPEGVVMNGFTLSPAIDKCEGCDRLREFDGETFCSSYPNPTSKWSGGRCNFATHVKLEVTAAAKVNPLKASKRAAKGR